jgi:hypothetical protein
MSEDDPSSERCPICEDKECQRHLLACFDASGDEGEFGVGLVGGALHDVTEIETVLERARLAWVQSMRATGKPKAPPWIMKERGLGYYFRALGGIDVEKYDNDEDAAHDLAVQTDDELGHARDDFLDEVLFSCGWLGDRTGEPLDYGGFYCSSTYLNWWAFKPREIVKKFRAKLRSILLEANSTATRAKKGKRTKSAGPNKRGRMSY